MKIGKIITFLLMGLFFFGIPILLMENFSGWTPNGINITSSIIDSPILRAYAESLYTIMFISSFLLMIPVLLYIGIIFWISGLISRMVVIFNPKNILLSNVEFLKEDKKSSMVKN